MGSEVPAGTQPFADPDGPPAEASVLRMLPGAQLRRLAEAEQLTGAVYLDQRADAEHYPEVVDQLSGEALTPAGTTVFTEQTSREL